VLLAVLVVVVVGAVVNEVAKDRARAGDDAEE
jgi:hypothetical protein